MTEKKRKPRRKLSTASPKITKSSPTSFSKNTRKKAGLTTREPVRLNRYIAQAGICSRREADKLIAAGEIKVNGKVVTELGTKVTPRVDDVQYRGKQLRAEKLVYFLLNKPKNTITTTDDPQGRRTVLDLLTNTTEERIFPVGRLDRNTTGLLLLTNDGDLAKKMTHPSHKVKKIYHVRLHKEVPEEDLHRLLDGVELEDGIAQVDKIDYVLNGGKNEVGVEIHIGRNRIVRRMFEHMGYKVENLDRVSISHLTKKNLPRGKWRALTDKEIAFLKMI